LLESTGDGIDDADDLLGDVGGEPNVDVEGDTDVTPDVEPEPEPETVTPYTPPQATAPGPINLPDDVKQAMLDAGYTEADLPVFGKMFAGMVAAASQQAMQQAISTQASGTYAIRLLGLNDEAVREYGAEIMEASLTIPADQQRTVEGARYAQAVAVARRAAVSADPATVYADAARMFGGRKPAAKPRAPLPPNQRAQTPRTTGGGVPSARAARTTTPKSTSYMDDADAVFGSKG
jgi:hypothetical protein